MDGLTLTLCAAVGGGAALVYLKVVSNAIEGVARSLEGLEKVERSAQHRREEEGEPPLGAVVGASRTAAVETSSVDDAAGRK